jgi:hypothetical protein
MDNQLNNKTRTAGVQLGWASLHDCNIIMTPRCSHFVTGSGMFRAHICSGMSSHSCAYVCSFLSREKLQKRIFWEFRKVRVSSFRVIRFEIYTHEQNSVCIARPRLLWFMPACEGFRILLNCLGRECSSVIVRCTHEGMQQTRVLDVHIIANWVRIFLSGAKI